MSTFDFWFLVIYTTFVALSIIGLMWVGEREERRQAQHRQHVGAKK